MMRLAVFLALLAAVTLYAFRRGGTPEKQVSTVLVGIQLVDMLYHYALGASSRYLTVDTFHAFNDAWPLVALLAIALTADRFWPLWVAALQVIAAFSHYARAVDLSVHPMAYAIMIRLPIWLQVVVLVLGTWSFARRQKARAALPISPPF